MKVGKYNNIIVSISKGSKFGWENTAGEVMAWVSDTGEAVFDTIQVIVLNVQELIIKKGIVVAREAEISGSANFDEDEETLEIETEKVKEDSLIYITPTTKTDGLVLYLKEINEGKSFTVALDQSSDLKEIIGLSKEATPSAFTTIKFNWLIINQQ